MLTVFCRVCEADTVPLENGYCPWCDCHPVTGEVNFEMRTDTKGAVRATQLRHATQRHRGKQPTWTCWNCLSEHTEPYCVGCGKDLTPKITTAPASTSREGALAGADRSEGYGS